ncbi:MULTISPECIES: ATP-binding protein [Dickeya]|uniref:ATP-binding protein n=1 Tax=Dickeya oryzae TaxID=1240404 RepID=A0AB39ISE0_9GAMM|nr:MULTISPECIES: ATP-binding protein [Dickeya]MCA6985469.1 ATP-binding protein [Dickeya zeae]MCA6990796.1 ATP-binding protein [Dickeya oryzae]
MRYPFELDPQIIHHIIYSQAGSIGKAIIELLMNSVDAQAKAVVLSLDRTGFSCVDDGTGFASLDDVINYFGRFGTPHQEGDATYGRFRLGRGQIMAHARTVWQSTQWRMRVDTREMGYSYDLDELEERIRGCHITGEWYEPLSDVELVSAVQEIRDLVRYTPVSITLNGAVITRAPALEQWDAEDEFAWYRLKAEGAVAIYNQGVLVRHDPGHVWGCGGLIVSKQAVALNVSRTEILRKTCPVWQSISKTFARLANDFTGRLGANRKTENRREKTARSLLSGEGDYYRLCQDEEVITILPGKRHVSFSRFLGLCRTACRSDLLADDDGAFEGAFVVSPSSDIPIGERLAMAGIIAVVHPVTLTRFGCHSSEEFLECLDRIHDILGQWIVNNDYRGRWLYTPALASFEYIAKQLVDVTALVSEKAALDAETRRAWVALRWCLREYARRCCSNGVDYQILLGESNSAAAWTDGRSYIAFNVNVVRRLKSEPLQTAGYLFSLTEHEVAHEGDSIDCGHDEVFYQRFHDISIRMAEKRQRYMHVWLMKYTISMEAEGKRAQGKAWQERFLSDRVGSGREKRGLPGTIDPNDVAGDIRAPISDEDETFIQRMNLLSGKQRGSGAIPDWTKIIPAAVRAHKDSQAQRAEADRCERERIAALLGIQPDVLTYDDLAELSFPNCLTDEDITEAWKDLCGRKAEEERDRCEERKIREHYAALFQVKPEDISDRAFYFLYYETQNDEDALIAWKEKHWEHDDEFDPYLDYFSEHQPEAVIPAEWKGVRPGETRWSLERNASAAGFWSVTDYLAWRDRE